VVNANLFQSFYVSVEHLNPDSPGANTEGFVADPGLAAVHCNIQPATFEVTALNNGAYGKSYTVFTTNSGILETDRITTVSGTSSKVYIVKGKEFFNWGLAQHIELFVVEPS